MFRFSIRDCLLAVPLVAVSFAWICEKGRVDTMEYEATGLRQQILKREQYFLQREAALEAKLMPPRPRRMCSIGMDALDYLKNVPDCCDPSSPTFEQ